MKKNRWDDHFTRQARREKWLARSVYKIREIDEKYHIIGKGHRLLDLGCYPGSWSQFGIKKVGPEGKVTGVDLTRANHLAAPNFRFIKADVLSLDTEWLARETGHVDMVMSDLAPRTSGIRLRDEALSMSLARKASEIALALLKKKGHFVCKIFEGDELGPFRSEVSASFRELRLFRPKATRKRSREVYLIGLDRLL
ncbi:MAG: RlmE family RNA methyltransferase [Desulfobacterales bacterium]|nr:RlmE family RNA methyltransferase [Desulfobacterales bacterium]